MPEDASGPIVIQS